MTKDEERLARLGQFVSNMLYVSPVLIILALAATAIGINWHIQQGPHKEVSELDKQIAVLSQSVNQLNKAVERLNERFDNGK